MHLCLSFRVQLLLSLRSSASRKAPAREVLSLSSGQRFSRHQRTGDEPMFAFLHTTTAGKHAIARVGNCMCLFGGDVGECCSEVCWSLLFVGPCTGGILASLKDSLGLRSRLETQWTCGGISGCRLGSGCGQTLWQSLATPPARTPSRCSPTGRHGWETT